MSTRTTPLTQKQLGQLRELVENQLDRVLRSVDGAAATAASIQEQRNNDDALGRLEAMSSQQFLGTLTERVQTKLNELRKALLRLDSGEYGVCVICGGAIPFARLEVLPEADSCVSCG